MPNKNCNLVCIVSHGLLLPSLPSSLQWRCGGAGSLTCEESYNFPSHLSPESLENYHFLPASLKSPKDVYGILVLSVADCTTDRNFSKYQEVSE